MIKLLQYFLHFGLQIAKVNQKSEFIELGSGNRYFYLPVMAMQTAAFSGIMPSISSSMCFLVDVFMISS